MWGGDAFVRAAWLIRTKSFSPNRPGSSATTRADVEANGGRHGFKVRDDDTLDEGLARACLCTGLTRLRIGMQCSGAAQSAALIAVIAAVAAVAVAVVVAMFAVRR